MFYPLLFPTPLSQQICTAAVSPLWTKAVNEISRYLLQSLEKVSTRAYSLLKATTTFTLKNLLRQ